jgi:transcriptional regulator with XRE-family HTH domain
MLSRGITQKEIAAQFGVSKQLISEIKRGHCWKEVA